MVTCDLDHPGSEDIQRRKWRLKFVLDRELQTEWAVYGSKDKTPGRCPLLLRIPKVKVDGSTQLHICVLCVSAGEKGRCQSPGKEVLSIGGQSSGIDAFPIPTNYNYACSSRIKWLYIVKSDQTDFMWLCRPFTLRHSYDMAWSFEIFSPSEWLCECNEKLWWTGGIENAAEGERGASGCQTFTQPTTTFSLNNFGLHTEG